MSRVALLSLVLLAVGCGQKGPLYFAPPPEPQASPEAVENAEPDIEPDEGGGVDPAEIDDPVRP